ncbi:MAG: L-2-amino-thiazoline-4-carboxylic acid hydrolase [Desulfobacterales bacterium]|nr:L-2-amino-thiazoline-4-carboxylic acid hydrolase [Desulfobacterales bacterium]
MDPQILSEYFKKCYIAVDGLWFMMLEKTDSFEKALEIDGRVWEILPKIQARKIKELLKLETATEKDLISALKFKLEAEDFVSELLRKDSQINITIKKCPWLALLKKSNREHLAERISDVICSVEYGVFAGEFMEDMDFKVISRQCSGDKVCSFVLGKCLT